MTDLDDVPWCTTHDRPANVELLFGMALIPTALDPSGVAYKVELICEECMRP